jgi:hypothetical protein
MAADLAPNTGVPWGYAGHVRGAWRLVEPTRAPAGLPFPGVHAAATPLVFYDSVAVSSGKLGAGALAVAEGWPGRYDRRRARSAIALRGGAFGLDESALTFERGDSLQWVRAETSDSRRGSVDN